MALSLKERCKKRLVGLHASRKPYEAEWREIASYAQPARSRFLNTETNKAHRQRNNRLNSSHGIFAFRTLQGGMTSGLSSPSRPWFTQTMYDDALTEDPEVRIWLNAVEKAMYAFLASTNFYGAVKTGYLELGLFATEACVMVEHPVEGAVCHQLTAGEYWIGLGSALTAEALYRRCPMTVLQAVQRFKWEKLSQRIRDAYDRSNYEDVCDFNHAIEINDEREEGYADSRGMAYRSAYWDENESGLECTDVRGYEEQPFWAPRWDTAGADAWGQGPGHDALPDLRELQLQAKRKGEATDYHIWPEIVVPSRIKLRRQPKSVVAASSVDMAKIEVPYQVPYQAIEAVRLDLEACKDAINQATYADLFMAITNMAGIQPRTVEEIASRNEEKLTQLGPVIERVNNEKLTVAIDRTFGIMERAGLLPPAPPKVQEAGGRTKTEFVSILTQMQRMVGLGQIERTVGFVGNLVGSFPDGLDNLNIDAAINEYAERAGAPQKIIRSAKEVEAIRQSRADQQNMERMIAAAPAAKDGAMAAKLLAETAEGAMPLGGVSPL